MHTSKILQSSDFQYWEKRDSGWVAVGFESLFPDYHQLDRVGVVAPGMEEGVRQVGPALLALTTAFYDVHRAARRNDFFDYPQHFAFLNIRELEELGSAETILPAT